MKPSPRATIVFTNVAKTRRRRRVVGRPEGDPDHLIDWKGHDWYPQVRGQGRFRIRVTAPDLAVPDVGPGVG